MKAEWAKTTMAVLVACLLATSCSSAGAPADSGGTAAEVSSPTSLPSPADTSSPAPDRDSPAYTSDTYQVLDHWLCHPDRSGDACDIDLDITQIEPDGTHRRRTVLPDPDAPIDCFYVYPTVSNDPSPNSDLEPNDAELAVAKAQAAPFAPVCRIYAPMYRQITLAALGGTAEGFADRALSYGDVVDAWSHYLAHHNQGRGVVLIGHSQGAGHLRELLSRRIDPDPEERRLLVSAILLGTTVRVPVDAATGAHFQHLAPCTTRDDFGCLVSYSTYSEHEPPGEAGLFAGVRDDPTVSPVCTNPSALPGGAGPLNSILTARPQRDGDVQTPYVHYSGLAHGECVRAGDHHYLEIRYQPENNRPEHSSWPPDLGGQLSPQWGLHLIDVGLALGDLVDLVAHQGDQWWASVQDDQP